MSTARSTARTTSSRPTSSAPSRLLEAVRGVLERAATAHDEGGLPLPARLDRRGLRLARRHATPAFTEDHTLRAQQPLLGQQGRQRPPGARLAPHLRPAGADHQLLEQLRAVTISRKADPADDRQRAGRQAAAGVRRRPAGARLALRQGPLQRHPPRCWKRGRPGETYNVGGWNEKPNIEIVHTICALLDELRPAPTAAYARLITYVTDRPGHDRRYAIDARKIERELGWKPAETFETGIRKTVAAGTSTTPTGWRNVQSGAYRDWVATQLRRRGTAGMKILLLGKDGQVGWELQRSLAPLGEWSRSTSTAPDAARPTSADPERWPTTVRAVRPDVIVNAAAHTAVDKAESEPELARTLNATAPGVLAREAARASARWLVHYSTDYVFDGSGEQPWREDDADRPAQRLRPHQARRRAADPRQRLPRT